MTADPPRLTITSDLVGMCFELDQRPVTWRETTSYAAAVADLNRRYFNDTAGRTLIAPPMIAVAITWPIFARQFRLVPEALLPEEIAVTAVHADEHLVFRRPIHAGEAIAVKGRLISMRPTAAGAHTVTHLDLLDSDGEIVATEYHGAMYRGVECPDGGREIAAVPPVPEIGASADFDREIPIMIGRGLPYVYDGCTQIINPIHTSPAFARERAGLPDIVLQGTCSLALAAREIVNSEAEGDPARLEILACRFSRYIIPGTTARLRVFRSVKTDGTLEVCFELLNAEGRAALTGGFARIAC
jgi:acyl dehydratase